MIHAYSGEQLYSFAADNYSILRSYCSILEREGYWEGPVAVLKHSIYDILDLYIQTVLIRLALHCGTIDLEERRFIAELTTVNVYDIKPDMELEDRVLSETERFYKSPPILIQLCGLRDCSHDSSLMGLFFDALFNIQLSFAFMNDTRTSGVASFIHEYYSRIEAFLRTKRGYCSLINERYIFLKLCNGILENSARNLKEAGEDFEYYKKKFLYYIDEERVEKSAASGEAADIDRNTGSSDDDIKVNRELLDTVLENVQLQNNRESNAVEKILSREKNNTLLLKEAALDILLEELNGLVGLDNVKDEINSLINLIKVRKLREKHKLPAMDMTYHMVFTGSPGTGKTTVARIVAGIYKELGILTKGTLVETDRSGLVAGYVGQTAIKVKEVVDRAIGGVLFIDEAYSLTTATGTNDFGDEAIETLVKLMEDHRDNLVVIVAGYTEEMRSFLRANTGLVSRFNKFIDFADYSNDELIEILQVMSKKAGFCIEQDAIDAVRNIICSMDENKKTELGNARGIRNMFERFVVNQADRIVMLENPDVNDLSIIKLADVISK